MAAAAVAAAGLAASLPAAGASAPTLYGTVGPGYTIVLKDRAGKKVTRVKAGTYRIVVRDRDNDEHNFHLVGRGVDKSTGIVFTGTAVWTVKLVRGKTYRYFCDPHEIVMRGTFRVV